MPYFARVREAAVQLEAVLEADAQLRLAEHRHGGLVAVVDGELGRGAAAAGRGSRERCGCAPSRRGGEDDAALAADGGGGDGPEGCA